MRRFAVLGVLAVVLGAGCILNLQDFLAVRRANNAAPLSLARVISENLSSFDAPPPASEPVAIRIVNKTEYDADTVITMRLAGLIVHLSNRLVPASSEIVVVGPDRAETVLAEASLRRSEPFAFEPTLYQRNVDFSAGSVIEHVLELDDGEPFEPPPNEPPPNEPPPVKPVQVSIAAVDAAPCVNPGESARYRVTAANLPAGAKMNVRADRDTDPLNGNEIAIVSNAVAAATANVVWSTTGVPARTYRVFAEIVASGRTTRSIAVSTRVNAIPSLAFDSPLDGALVSLGDDIVIGWGAADADDNAVIRFFLDPDGVKNGDESFLQSVFHEDDEDHTLLVDSGMIGVGEYYVGAEISDCAGPRFVYGPRICITDRLAGEFDKYSLGGDRLTIITGQYPDPNDYQYGVFYDIAFGYDVDASRDINGDGAGDLIASAPLGVRDYGKGQFYRGATYFHSRPRGDWPATMGTHDLTRRVVGKYADTMFGASIALSEPINGGARGTLIVGAPEDRYPSGRPAGAVMTMDASMFLDDPNFSVEAYDEDSSIFGRIDGDYDTFEHAGEHVAAVGDVNGDGYPDFATGSPRYLDNQGRYAVVYGNGEAFESGQMGWIGSTIPGALYLGEAEGDRLGSAIVAIGAFFCDAGAGQSGSTCEDFDDIAVSAPGARSGAGVIYLLDSDPDRGDLPPSIADVARHVLVGENPGDEAGASLAAADLDHDRKQDLIIGAPMWNDGTGRVYVVYNFDGQDLPHEIALAEVGSSIAGFVIDGSDYGDRFGFSVARAGHFDSDRIDDAVIGAPGVNDSAGAIYLIYGGQQLIGSYALASLHTCSLQGFEFAGNEAGGMLGYSVSGGGDLNRDGRGDIAAGAPGYGVDGLPVPGRVYLLFSGEHPFPQADDPIGGYSGPYRTTREPTRVFWP